MKHFFAIALVLLAISCSSHPEGSIKSLQVSYPQLSDYSEAFEFSYNETGLLAKVEESYISEGKKQTFTKKYSYDKLSLSAQVKSTSWGMTRDAQAVFADDFNHLVSFTIEADVEEDPETGICFLGQKWECSYEDGYLVKSWFYDFTSDGIDVNLFSWSSEGDLVAYDGSDPGVSVSYRDIVYLDEPNPFKGIDPLALLLGAHSFYWQGLCGARPSKLIHGYSCMATDNAGEESNSQITFEYQRDDNGRITQISRLRDGLPDKTIAIEY